MMYLAIAIGLGLIGLLCWVVFFLFFRKNPEKFHGINVAVALLILGPLLPIIRTSLAKRNHETTSRERWGLLAMLAVFIIAIAISLIFGVGIRGR